MGGQAQGCRVTWTQGYRVSGRKSGETESGQNKDPPARPHEGCRGAGIDSGNPHPHLSHFPFFW